MTDIAILISVLISALLAGGYIALTKDSLEI